MELNEYQTTIRQFDVFDQQSGDLSNPSFVAKILGLAGETGEVCEKFKKIYRDKGGKMTDKDKVEISKELGDVLWYIATIARYLNIPLEEVATQNIDKLASRQNRNQLHGSGDNR